MQLTEPGAASEAPRLALPSQRRLESTFITSIAPHIELRGLPVSPELIARLVHWSDVLRRHAVEPGDCTVLVERDGWPPGASCRVQARVVLLRRGYPAVVMSDAAEVSTGSELEVIRQAEAAVDRVFTAVLETMTGPIDAIASSDVPAAKDVTFPTARGRLL